MHDPFADLRAADEPIDPAPEFATRLRARVQRALALPRGVSPITTATQDAAQIATRSAVVPYLAVADARGAIDWYRDVFGAELRGEPVVMPDGRIGHAELTLAGGAVYLADAHPEIGVTAPRAGEAPVSLMVPVSDTDAVRARALAAGARADREPYDDYGSRNAWIVDPFGHRWGLHSPLRSGYRDGDLTHISLRTPDPSRAAEFYRAVLGWQIVDDQVPGAAPSVGIWTGAEPALVCVYAVADLTGACARVVAAGGRAGRPRPEPYGRRADCVDDQGSEFALHEVTAGTDRPAPHGRRAGDLAYLTLEVVDSARARAFYGAVLGWTFTPGRVADGWQVEGTAPMVGLSGGHDRVRAVPMWRVDDIERAVTAVRSRGGTAAEPQRQSYGTTSECTDDQGSRFYLGEL